MEMKNSIQLSSSEENLYQATSIIFFIVLVGYILWNYFIAWASWGTATGPAHFYTIISIGALFGGTLNYFTYRVTKKDIFAIFALVCGLIILVHLPFTYNEIINNPSTRETFGIRERENKKFELELAQEFANPIVVKSADIGNTTGLYMDLVNGRRVHSVDVGGLAGINKELQARFTQKLNGSQVTIQPAWQRQNAQYPQYNPHDVYLNTPLPVHVYSNGVLIDNTFIYQSVSGN